MQKSLIVIGVFIVSVFVVACAETPVDMPGNTNKSKKTKFHGDMVTKDAAPKVSVTESLKKNSLNGYPQKTIGEAFDAYSKVAAREWREVQGKDGKYYVDYIGWFPESSISSAAKAKGVVRKGFNVKFAVQEDGTTYVTLGTKLFLMQDGKLVSEVVPLSDVSGILDMVYADREFVF